MFDFIWYDYFDLWEFEMASQFANTLCINQEIIITLKWKKNPRDSLIFVTSEHFDSPKVFISLRLSKVCWDDAMLLRDTQFISCQPCTSGVRQARFTHVSTKHPWQRAAAPACAPEFGLWKAGDVSVIHGRIPALIAGLLRCDYILTQRKRLWSHWGFVRLFFPSFALLPLRLSQWFISRGAAPVSVQTMLLSQQPVLQHAVSETKLLWITCIFCTSRILAWRGVYPKKRTLEV